MNTLNTTKKIATASLLLLLTACASGPRYGGNVSYGDEKGIEQVTNEFGSTDLQMIAETLSRQLLQDPTLARVTEKVRMRVSDIKNKTTEYIDTKIISDKIRRQLLGSGKVVFVVDDASMQKQVDDLRRQNQSGLYSSSGTAKTGRMVAEKYRLEGSISSITKRGSNVKDVFYIFEMSMTDVESGTIIWAGEREIRKTSGR